MAEIALAWSVSSITCEEPPSTEAMRPTRPSPLITGSSTWTPSPLPTSIVTLECQTVGERAITRPVTGSYAEAASAGPRSSSTSLRSCAFSCSASWPATACVRAVTSSDLRRLFSPRASKVLSNQSTRSRAGFRARSATDWTGLKIVLTPRCRPREPCP